MRRLAVVLLLSASALLGVTSTAWADGTPQGPIKQGWICVFDLDPVSGAPTWHCVPPGVLANLGGPSAPSLNYDGAPADPFTVSLGPPEGTTFVGTENGKRTDLGNESPKPCPQGTSSQVDIGAAEYFFCHHYGG